MTTGAGAKDAELVSCIMPTYNRRAYIPRAIEYFLQQDYPNLELLIVDDGTDAIADLVPADARIRYIRLHQRLSIGAKRNLACREAAGVIIAHWDDDDWQAPHRLSLQIGRMKEAGAQMCGTRNPIFFHPASNRAWQYVYPDDGKSWVCGNSMCYTRDHWARIGFTDISNGEDTYFAWSSGEALAIADEGYHIGILHGENAGSRPDESSRWREYPTQRVLELMGPDASRYTGATSEAAPTALQRREDVYQGYAVARETDLGYPEFIAYNQGQNLPRMRCWELPYILFQSRLPQTAAVLDCTINPSGFGQRLKQLYPFVQYHHAPALQNGALVRPSGFPDGAFDRVFCVNTLEHLVRGQREMLVRDMAGKLKPGGALALTSDYYFDESWSDAAFLGAGVMRADRTEFVNGWNRVPPSEWVELCVANGLQPAASPPLAPPARNNAGLFLQAAPFAHAVMGGMFTKGEPEYAARKRIVLALLTWNTREVSVDALRAHIREAAMLNRLGLEAMICVCDNGSTDGSREAFEALVPEMRSVEHRFLFNSDNRGNSIGRNQIIDCAMSAGADYLMFVDGDVELVPFSTFAMYRYLETHGGLLGSIGADSRWQTVERQRAAPALFSIAGQAVETVNLVAWTQYGLFRREVFEEGVRFDEEGPFGIPGWGFEDNDLAFQMEVRGFLNQRFSGMLYLHRAARSSVRNLEAQGIDPLQLYSLRRDYIVRKWAGTQAIATGPLELVRRVRW